MHSESLKPLSMVLLVGLCVIYVALGYVGRVPVYGDDATSFAVMVELAKGNSDWLEPHLLGESIAKLWLEYWLGAFIIKITQGLIDAWWLIRVWHALLFVAAVGMLWATCKRLSQAQVLLPQPPIFSAPVVPERYARVSADLCVLIFLANLGLITKGHETSAVSLQILLTCATLYSWSFAQQFQAKSLLGLSLCTMLLALGGVPLFALWLGCILVWEGRSHYRKLHSAWIIFSLSVLLQLYLALAFIATPISAQAFLQQLLNLLINLAWFYWPTWPLIIAAFWVGRKQLFKAPLRPLLVVTLGMLVLSLWQQSAETQVLLALPAIALLAACTLPQISYTLLVIIDWIASTFYSLLIIYIWSGWFSMHFRFPVAPVERLEQLLPGFQPQFSLIALVFAIVVTLLWFALIYWRIFARSQAIWRGMVLSTAGLTTAWGLTFSLWLPILNYSNSLQPMTESIAMITQSNCINPMSMNAREIASLYNDGRLTIVANTTRCRYFLVKGTSNAEQAELAVRFPQSHLIWSGRSQPERGVFYYLFQRLQ